MKNQYFGDVRDYLKYSLLMALGCDLSVAVCWLLTPDDPSTDGRKTDYLCNPDRWLKYDPPIYDFLHKQVVERRIRCVEVLEHSGLLGDNTRFFSELVPDCGLQRCEYFDKFMEQANGADLIFFDPDTGIEPSVSARDPSTYIGTNWTDHFGEGHSLLVYQHFGRRESHDQFARSMN